MLPYWILLGTFSAGALVHDRRPGDDRTVSLALAICAILTVAMVGLRYKVGSDWGPYRDIFWEMKFLTWSSALTRTDPAFSAINWLVRRAGLEFWVVNTICAGIFIYGLVKLAARQDNPWLVFAMAIPYVVIVFGMAYVRQATALGFVFLALCAVEDRSFKRFVVLMLIAATFHRSAIILLPIISIAYTRNRVIILGASIAALVIGYVFLLQDEITTYVDRYSGAEQGNLQSDGTLVRLFMNALPGAIFLMLQKRFRGSPELRKTWRNLSILSLVSLAAFLYLGANTAIDRLAGYLLPLQLYVVGNLPTAIRKDGRNQRAIVILLLLYAAFVQVVWLVFASNAEFWIPYRIFPLGV